MAEGRSLVGGRLGQFDIKDEIARGGMGVVYKGYQPSLDRWVAIKTLPLEFSGDRDLVSRFHREAEAMVRLNHANIVQIIDRGQDQGQYFFAMEYVEGASVKDLLKSTTIDMGKLFDVLIQTCEGLEYAHKKGIVHRDVKPANLLYEEKTSTVKIADFGIARLMKKDVDMLTLTADNVGMGTMNYMAPEQKMNAKDVDHRADIYALGVIIYEAFTGKLPLGKFKLPTEVSPKLPRKLDEVVQKCLEAEPADRYQSCAEVKAGLVEARAAAAQGGTIARSVRDAAERTLTALGPNRTLAVALVALVALGGLGVVGVGGYFVLRPKPVTPVVPPSPPPNPVANPMPSPTPTPPAPAPAPTPPAPAPNAPPSAVPSPTPPAPAPAPAPLPPAPAPTPSPPASVVSKEDQAKLLKSKREFDPIQREVSDGFMNAKGSVPAAAKKAQEEAQAAFERASDVEVEGDAKKAALAYAEAREKFDAAGKLLVQELQTALASGKKAAEDAGADTHARAGLASAKDAERQVRTSGALGERARTLVHAIEAYARATEDAQAEVVKLVQPAIEDAAAARDAAMKRGAEGQPGFQRADESLVWAKGLQQKSTGALKSYRTAARNFDLAHPPAPRAAKRTALKLRTELHPECDYMAAVAANEDGVFVLAGSWVYVLDHALAYKTRFDVGAPNVSGLAACRGTVYVGTADRDEVWAVRAIKKEGDSFRLQPEPVATLPKGEEVRDLATDSRGDVTVLAAKSILSWKLGSKEKKPVVTLLSGEFRVARAIAVLDDGRVAVSVATTKASALKDESQWTYRVAFYKTDGSGVMSVKPHEGPTQLSGVTIAGGRVLGVDHNALAQDPPGGGLHLFPAGLDAAPQAITPAPTTPEEKFKALTVKPMNVAAWGKKAYVLCGPNPPEDNRFGLERPRLAAFDLD